MTKTKADRERVAEIASAHAYLATARRCIMSAIICLNKTDVEIEEELWETDDGLDKLMITLHEEMRKEVKE